MDKLIETRKVILLKKIAKLSLINYSHFAMKGHAFDKFPFLNYIYIKYMLLKMAGLVRSVESSTVTFCENGFCIIESERACQ